MQSLWKLLGKQDWVWIWLDFPDFKHDYHDIKDIYWSNVCFACRGPWTVDFHGDCQWTVWYKTKFGSQNVATNFDNHL